MISLRLRESNLEFFKKAIPFLAVEGFTTLHKTALLGSCSLAKDLDVDQIKKLWILVGTITKYFIKRVD